MKTSIIGCGYVGEAVARNWKKHHHTVSATTTDHNKIAYLSTFVDEVFLLNSKPLSDLINRQEIALICVAPKNSESYASTYLKTAKEVIDSIKDESELRQIIYTSSTSVYGNHQGNWVNEMTPTQSLNEQSDILRQTEQLLLNHQKKNLKVCLFRLGEIFGPNRQIEDRLKKISCKTLPGTGQNHTNMIHLIDIVAAVDFAIEKGLEGIYNLCNDDHIPRKLFYERLCQLRGIPFVTWDSKSVSPYGGDKRVSNEKIKSKGFKFAYPTYFSEQDLSLIDDSLIVRS